MTKNLATVVLLVLLCIFATPSSGQEKTWCDVLTARANVEDKPKPGPTSGWTEASWMKLKLSKKLNWINCYNGLQCARLIVPLDYSDPNGATAIIAMTRKQAGVSSNSPDYKGPILINPGGPGGSGVSAIVENGDLLASFIGPNFDIIGFDPRGVSRSVPQVLFFKSPVERALFRAESSNNLALGVPYVWAYAQVEGQLAADTNNGYLVHINTDQTARDMLEIVHAHGRDKLQYYGISYGSMLGLTFAAMFPDKVERIVVDGVQDIEDYYSTSWLRNLLDTDKDLDTFFTGCVAAGPQNCAFHADTPEEIASNLNSLFESVRAKPLAVHTNQSYGLLDYIRLRSTVGSALYSPFATFSRLAQGLADLAAGNPETIFALAETVPFSCSESDIPPPNDQEAATAIICNDGEDIPGTLEDAQNYTNTLLNISQWGDLFSTNRIGCSGWPKLQKTHFKGPFVGNTSYPILFIGNTADPVTPISGAIKTAQGFPGAVVLTQDSADHTSQSATSVCTLNFMKQYFQNGTLPKPGTVCPVVGSPFTSPMGPSSPDPPSMLGRDLDSADQTMLKVAQELSRTYPVFIPWRMKL